MCALVSEHWQVWFVLQSLWEICRAPRGVPQRSELSNAVAVAVAVAMQENVAHDVVPYEPAYLSPHHQQRSNECHIDQEIWAVVCV